MSILLVGLWLLQVSILLRQQTQVTLVQSQRVHTNTGVHTWLIQMMKQLQTEIQVTGDRDHALSVFEFWSLV